MSIVDPICGVDVSPNYQPNFNFELAQNQNIRVIIGKSSEGPYRDGTVLEMLNVKEWFSRLRAHAEYPGAYHYLIETDPQNTKRGGQLQADHFLRRLDSIGGIDGLSLWVDFEWYNPPYRYLTPTNGTLAAFVESVKNRVDNHPIGVYTSDTFWNGGIPSGRLANYGLDMVWAAAWPEYDPNDPLPTPFQSYQYYVERDWDNWDTTLGGVEKDGWQFGIGSVAGMNVDCDAWRVDDERLRLYGQGGGIVDVPADPTQPVDEDPNKPDDVWNPVTDSLAPPGFVKQRPIPSSPNYEVRNPTRYEFRADVEQVVRNLYKEFGKDNISINTYVNHPEIAPRPNVSFDVWGPNGRDDPLPWGLGDQVFWHIFRDPDPSWTIEWCIWRRLIRFKKSGYVPQSYGTNRFEFHDDHIHETISGPYHGIG